MRSLPRWASCAYTAPVLQINGLTKSFGARTLFRDVTWLVNPGDRIGLVGPNGTGKTTLLRILSGSETADDGAVTKPNGTTIGYLAQDIKIEAQGRVLEHTMRGATRAAQAKDELDRATAALERADGDVDALTASHAEALERFEAAGGYDLEARARSILVGLGFPADGLDREISELSGGWAMRAELARLLLMQPSVLLLDEPTNHLDIESIDWLERFLDDYRGAWVVVSHDRYFLNRMVDRVAELSAHGLLVFEGDYDRYIEAREELDAQLTKEAAQTAKRMAEIEGFVERFRAKASKAKQAQSRVKLLDRMRRKAESAPKARGTHASMTLNLPTPPRSGDEVFDVQGLVKRFGDHTVYNGLNLALRRGDRVALVGPNGAGKSTLLKILAGQERPSAGECKLGHNVTRYYFAQHQSDSLDRNATPLSILREAMPLEKESRIRSILGAFLFRGDDVEKPVRVLSGGEKARVALARMMAQPANLLLLDEPTNHLDLQSRAVLEQALAEFAGTVVIVSHDRYFINRIAKRIVEIEPGGRASSFLGNYDYYAWKKAEVADTGVAQAVTSEPTDYKARKRAQREQERAQRRAAELERAIEDLEARMSEVDARMVEAASDSAKLQGLHDERQQMDAELTDLYAEWERSHLSA